MRIVLVLCLFGIIVARMHPVTAQTRPEPSRDVSATRVDSVGNNTKDEEHSRREIKEEINVDVEVTGYLARVDHAYSHFRIGVDVFTCEYKAGKVRLKGATDHRWILIDEIDRFAFPGANHKFIPILKSRLAGNTAR